MTGENSLYDYYCNGLSGCRRQLVFPANSLHANRLFYPLVSLNVYKLFISSLYRLLVKYSLLILKLVTFVIQK